MTIYQSIETLPILNFNKCRETDDLRYLIKGVDIDQLPDMDCSKFIDTWNFIKEQYFDEIEITRKRNNNLDTIKRIYRLECDKQIISINLLQFTMTGDEESQKELRRLGYAIDRRNIETFKDRHRQALKIKQRVKTIDAKISVLNRELENTNENTEPVDFDSVVWTAEKHFKKDLDPAKISVKKWIKIENDLLKHIQNGKDKK